MDTQQRSFRNIIIVAVILVLAVLAYAVLTMPDRRNTTEKIGDAIHDLPQGADKAARQLEDRTPGQKLGDTIKDNTAPPHD
jgi:short subunit fatty acids transporter